MDLLFLLLNHYSGCWPDLTRKSLYCQCWGSLFQNSSQTSTSDNVDGFDAQIANRRDQEHRQILEQLGFDPNLEADGYIAPSNTVNSMDCSLLNQRSPSIAYNEVKDKTVPGLIENCECSICMCEMEDTDKVRLLACKHAFHVKCIDPWILHCKSVCPLCRQNVLD